MVEKQDPTIKIKTEVKNKLEKLDFVGYKTTASQIIKKLIEHYEKTKRKKIKNETK